MTVSLLNLLYKPLNELFNVFLHYDSLLVKPFSLYKPLNELFNVFLHHGSHKSKGWTEKVRQS